MTHLDAPDLKARSAAGVGKCRVHDTSAGLLAVLGAGLYLSCLHGESRTGVKRSGRAETGREGCQQKKAEKGRC